MLPPFSRASCARFNEAAGFTQRKRARDAPAGAGWYASMRPPVLPSGNPHPTAVGGTEIANASMRPPVLPSGNRHPVYSGHRGTQQASMRPPVLPSGNAALVSPDFDALPALQ